jgi:hypothetical protein
MKTRIHTSFTILLFLFLGVSFLTIRCTPGKVAQMPSPTMLTSRLSTSSLSSKMPGTSRVAPTKSTPTAATKPPNASTPLPTETITPTPPPLPSRTLAPSLTSTMEPTLTDQFSEAYILELLETNGDCALPCFWGIIPGQTALEEAKRSSYHLGWHGGDYFNGTIFATGRTYLNQHLTVLVSFFKSTAMVGSIHVSIAGENYLNLVKAYTFKQIISTYGVPTQVWINLATALEINTPDVTAFCTQLYYKESAILAKYCGSAVKIGSAYRLCPTNPNYGNQDESATQGAVSLTLGIPGKMNTPEELIKPFGPFDGMKTIDEALGLSPFEFYNKAVSNQSLVCYETQRDIWP